MKKLMIMTLIFSVVFLNVAFATGKEDVSRLLRSFEKVFNNLKSFERELKSETDTKSLGKEFEETYKLVIDAGDEVYSSSYQFVLSKKYDKLKKDVKSIRFKLLHGEAKQEISSAIVTVRETVIYFINCLMNE